MPIAELAVPVLAFLEKAWLWSTTAPPASTTTLLLLIVLGLLVLVCLSFLVGCCLGAIVASYLNLPGIAYHLLGLAAPGLRGPNPRVEALRHYHVA